MTIAGVGVMIIIIIMVVVIMSVIAAAVIIAYSHNWTAIIRTIIIARIVI